MNVERRRSEMNLCFSGKEEEARVHQHMQMVAQKQVNCYLVGFVMFLLLLFCVHQHRQMVAQKKVLPLHFYENANSNKTLQLLLNWYTL